MKVGNMKPYADMRERLKLIETNLTVWENTVMAFVETWRYIFCPVQTFFMAN